MKTLKELVLFEINIFFNVKTVFELDNVKYFEVKYNSH